MHGHRHYLRSGYKSRSQPTDQHGRHDGKSSVRSVQLFVQGSCPVFPIVYKGPRDAPFKNLPLSLGGSRHMVLLAHPSLLPKWHLDRFGCFCRAHGCVQHRPHYICSSRLRVRCGLKIVHTLLM